MTQIKRCSILKTCPGECLDPNTAMKIVVLTTTLAMAVPILDSLGLSMGPLVPPARFTFEFFIYVIVWLLAIVVGCARKHDNEVWCLIDSFGIPGIVAVAVGLKTVLH
jgi:hypothetical protein